MKIAHLIIAHKNILQLERLVKRLEHPQFDIYIHLDKKVNIEKIDFRYDSNRVFFIQKRIVCNWGGFSIVKAITNSIREILLMSEKYEFINLLSAQDYPIKPIDSLYDFLKENKGHSFISFEKTNDCDWWKSAVTRYELYHFTDYNIKGRYIFQKILNSLMPKRKFPYSFKLYGGNTSTWWTLNSDCAQYIIECLDDNPLLMKFMKFTWAADEFLYPTIIMNSPFKESSFNNNLRFIEWEDGKASPKIFINSDFNKLKSSNQFFARKFDAFLDSEILDELDKIIKYDNNNFRITEL